ncbi:hypothetical protein [Vibrio gallaecicus]|nr:hypothetical protein [Vibrio gallaecicus]MDN3617125.1 hypothetical protein [Vibrio gallaecicus]
MVRELKAFLSRFQDTAITASLIEWRIFKDNIGYYCIGAITFT